MKHVFTTMKKNWSNLFVSKIGKCVLMFMLVVAAAIPALATDVVALTIGTYDVTGATATSGSKYYGMCNDVYYGRNGGSLAAGCEVKAGSMLAFKIAQRSTIKFMVTQSKNKAITDTWAVKPISQTDFEGIISEYDNKKNNGTYFSNSSSAVDTIKITHGEKGAGTITNPTNEIELEAGIYGFYLATHSADGDFISSIVISGGSTYSVTFNYNGKGGKDTTMTGLSVVPTLPTPAAETGYDFDGWYYDNAMWAQPSSAGDALTKDTAIYAKWVTAATEHTLTYNVNGGTGATAPAAVVVSVGDKTTIVALPAGLTKTGYMLNTTKWNTAADGSGTDYNVGDEVLVPNNITLYAVWTKQSVTITYDANGGSGTTEDLSSYYYGDTANILANAFTAPTGYYFDQWTTNADGTGTSYTAGDKLTLTKNVTLYAHWLDESLRPDTVQYVVGSLNVSNGALKQGGNGKVDVWKYDGVSLASTTDITVSKTLGTGGGLFDDTDPANLDVLLKWSTSSTDARSGRMLKINSVDSLIVRLGDLTATKVEFVGMCASSDAGKVLTFRTNKGSETKTTSSKDFFCYEFKNPNYADSIVITNTSGKEYDGILLVYALAARVTFDANGGTGTMPNQAIVIGVPTALSACMFNNNGENFGGWNTKADGTGTSYADEDSVTLTGNITLYAQWCRNAYVYYKETELVKSVDDTAFTNAVLSTPGLTLTYTSSDETVARVDANGEVTIQGIEGDVTITATALYQKVGGRAYCETSDSYVLKVKPTPCTAAPTFESQSSSIAFWDGKSTNITVAKVLTDYSSDIVDYTMVSATPTIAGCSFIYDEDGIHIKGTPTVGNTTNKTVTVTFTLQNNCTPAKTFTYSHTFTIYPSTFKGKIAFVVTGTKGGDWTAFTASDKTNSSNVINYLEAQGYEITVVNGYATKDVTDIENYYKDFDLIIVTDFLDTGEGYTNAIGTMIDKKPVLSFEAFVAGQSNWHIGSKPRTQTSPKSKDMMLLCAAHKIFEGISLKPGDWANVLDTAKTTGLQGFAMNNAPDFLFLAAIEDKSAGDWLITCCERQTVFLARMMIFGIQHGEMQNITTEGNRVIEQMIKYLLETDEDNLADCALVFDNGEGDTEPSHVSLHGDHLWSNPYNWGPGYNMVPTQAHPTRIERPCIVDTKDAHAGSVKINQGHDIVRNKDLTGSITINDNAGLTVASFVTKVLGSRCANYIETNDSDIVLKSTSNGNGALVYGNVETKLNATVEYYSRGTGSGTSTPTWQYIGIPINSQSPAIDLYYQAWMCYWSGTPGALGAVWQYVDNYDQIIPFQGYCITQASTKTYTLAGELNKPVEQVVSLAKRDEEGYAFAANSWTAPIKIQEFDDDDFVNAEKTIYIYHSGTYNEWSTHKEDTINATKGKVTNPGQYAVVPIHSAPYVAGADSVIPAMQGFFVKTLGSGASLKLNYKRVVYDSKYYVTTPAPTRISRRRVDANNDSIAVDSTAAESVNIIPNVLFIGVAGATAGDHVYLLENEQFTETYADGWDGRKADGDSATPSLSVEKPEVGDFAVAALPAIDDHYLNFRAGNDSVYKVSFEYEGIPLWLVDQVTKTATRISNSSTYTFTATNTSPQRRFLITSHPQYVPTAIETIADDESINIENYGNELVEITVCDMQGRVVYSRSSYESDILVNPSLPLGVYLARVKAGNNVQTIKLIGKEGSR